MRVVEGSRVVSEPVGLSTSALTAMIVVLSSRKLAPLTEWA